MSKVYKMLKDRKNEICNTKYLFIFFNIDVIQIDKMYILLYF